MRLLLGLAEAGFIPGAVYYLSQWFPSSRRGRVFGVFYLSLAGSGLIGGPLSGAVLAWMSGWLGVAGWKWLLVVEALPALAVGVLIMLLLPDRPRGAVWLSDAEQRHVADVLARDQAEQHGMSVAELWRSPVIWLLVVMYFLLNYAAYGLSFWLPTLVQGLGVRATLGIGLLSALPSLCSMVCMVIFGRSADRHGERRWHLTAMFLIGAAGFVVSVMADGTLAVGMLGLCMAAICTQAFPSLFWAVPTRMMSGVAAAAGLAMINAIGNLSGFFGPYAVGLLREGKGGSAAAVYSLAAALFLSALLVHALPPRLIDRHKRAPASAKLAHRA